MRLPIFVKYESLRDNDYSSFDEFTLYLLDSVSFCGLLTALCVTPDAIVNIRISSFESYLLKDFKNIS